MAQYKTKDAGVLNGIVTFVFYIKDLNIVDDNKIRRQGWAGEWKMKGYEKEVRKGKFHKRRPVEKQKIRWKDVIRRDTSKILGISGWSRTAEDREVWRRLLRKVMAQNGL